MTIEKLRQAAADWFEAADLSQDDVRILVQSGATVSGGVRLSGSPELELLVTPADGSKPPQAFRRWRPISTADFVLVAHAADLGTGALRRLAGEPLQAVVAAMKSGAHLAVFFRFDGPLFAAAVSLHRPGVGEHVELVRVEHLPESALH